MAEMKVYQREHFRGKINELLNPEIEKEEMLLSSTIADMTESAEKNLSKKIGADVIISSLEQAEQELEKARNKARIFLDKCQEKGCPIKNL
jgi:putative N-acetylmannosamine-6-phosphate epimerase